MDYLLDTHTILWFLNGDNSSLSNIAKDIIEDQHHTKFVSMSSVFEAGIKISIGKLIFPQNTEGFVEQVKKNGFEILPIHASHIIAMEKLPFIHRDPFDRLLVAAAIVEKKHLLSCDINIKQYQVNRVW